MQTILLDMQDRFPYLQPMQKRVPIKHIKDLVLRDLLKRVPW